MFRNRTPIEIMVLSFTVVVSLSIISLGVGVTVLEIQHPGIDTKGAATALFNLLSGMMGALLGLLAGKADAKSPPSFLEPLPPERPTPS